MLLVFYVADTYSSKRYYYFYNLGLSRSRLWFPVIIADLFLFLVIVLPSIYAAG